MRLLLDECAGDRSLRDALLAAGHDVTRSVDDLGGGIEDSAVFTFASAHERIVLTYNSADFRQLGEGQNHPGMLLIYQDNTSADMTVSQIVSALANVVQTYPDGIANEIVVLNAYRW